MAGLTATASTSAESLTVMEDACRDGGALQSVSVPRFPCGAEVARLGQPAREAWRTWPSTPQATMFGARAVDSPRDRLVFLPSTQ